MNRNLSAKYVATDLSGDPEAPGLTSTRIRNPLEGIPREQLMRDVEAFAEYRGLQDHVSILKKGALVAQDPGNAFAIDGPEKLNPDELEVLDVEVKHKWRMPMRLFLTIATCSIGAAVQGWDQTGSNGATIFFTKYYGLASGSDKDNLIVGLLNAGPYIGSASVAGRVSVSFGYQDADLSVPGSSGAGSLIPSTTGSAVEVSLPSRLPRNGRD